MRFFSSKWQLAIALQTLLLFVAAVFSWYFFIIIKIPIGFIGLIICLVGFGYGLGALTILLEDRELFLQSERAEEPPGEEVPSSE